MVRGKGGEGRIGCPATTEGAMRRGCTGNGGFRVGELDGVCEDRVSLLGEGK